MKINNKPMKDPIKSIEWMAFPKDIKEQVVSAYEEHHKALFSGDHERFWNAESKCHEIDKKIHKTLGINLDYLPANTNLESFISGLKSSMKTGYNIFVVEETDPLMNKINQHMEKFKTIKSAALRVAELNLEKSTNQEQQRN